MTVGLVTFPLPAAWAETSLAEIVTHRSGNTKLIKGKLPNAAGPGLLPAYSASGQDVWRGEADHEGAGVVISAVGARCGKAFKATGQWSAIANTHVVLPDGRAIRPTFLWYLINNEDCWIKSGTAQPFVKVRPSLRARSVCPRFPSRTASSPPLSPTSLGSTTQWRRLSGFTAM